MNHITLLQAQNRINYLNGIISILGTRLAWKYVLELNNLVAYIETLNWELGY